MRAWTDRWVAEGKRKHSRRLLEYHMIGCMVRSRIYRIDQKKEG